jgi:multidrug resistance protein MdtO
MATAYLRLPHADRFTSWFPDFLRKELAPYPGRGTIVARTVIAATLTMILIVTFRIPGGTIGALCAFLLSRENLASTAKSAGMLIGAFVLGGIFAPLGACFSASDPFTHFLWEAASLFVSFFLLRTFANYVVAIIFALVSTNTLAIWYLPGPVERNIELTLWQIAGSVIGALITFAVEVVFHAIYSRNDLIDGIDFRLNAVQDRLECYAAGTTPVPQTESKLAQFAIVGVGNLRRHLARTSYEPLYRMRMSTLVSLTGRSVDFAAGLSASASSLPDGMRPRALRLARQIADIRHCLETRGELCESEFEPEPGESTPLLYELETMVSLMPSIFSAKSAIDPRLDVLESGTSSNSIFVPDAFSNPEHLRYVLGLTLAAMICYVLYVALAWPGISTAVTTCVFTALSNVGASRQKQVLRIAGAILGGFVFGLGAQIFVLPYIDSIFGFSILFASVTAVAAWISASSSRLSYVGLQLALAFYLIHLSEFSIQISLTVGRDRAIGVLLGTTMMWLVFERFSPRKASDEMIRIFVRNLRLMAELTADTPSNADPATILKIRRQRDQVDANFGQVNAQADAVPFETGPLRAGNLAARDRIRRWQASLRTFYLLETPLLQFRVFGSEDEKSEAFVSVQSGFRRAIGETLRCAAANIEAQLDEKRHDTDRNSSVTLVLDRLQQANNDGFSPRERALLDLSHNVASLLDRIQDEVVAEPLYATS